jgi:arylsulfatase A-like enzyme
LLSKHRGADRPFFLSVGFFETHREFFEPSSVRDSLYSRPPANLPDTPEMRRDMAAFKASARSLDHGVGAVLDALDRNELEDDTLVIFTTDHGLAFPGAKATLTDRGLGVLLIIAGPGGFSGGRVIDSMVTQLDIYPTICELAGIDRPEWLRGESLLPIINRLEDEIHDRIFAEITFHAAYEPQRAVRTRRHKYIRHFDEQTTHPVLANVDDGPSKDYLLAHGWADRTIPREELYDLIFDPNEVRNLADDPAYADRLAELRGSLDRWMTESNDPLLEGPIAPAPGTEYNTPEQLSADQPTTRADPLDPPVTRTSK